MGLCCKYRKYSIFNILRLSLAETGNRRILTRINRDHVVPLQSSSSVAALAVMELVPLWKQSWVSSYHSSSSQSWSYSSLRSWSRSPAQVQASSLMVVPASVEYRLPLDSCVEGPLFPIRDSFPLVPVSCCVCRILEGGRRSCLRSCLVGSVVWGLLLREVLDQAVRMWTLRRNSPRWACFLYSLLCCPCMAAGFSQSVVCSVDFGRLSMDSEQPTSLYRFPVGDASSDTLTDIDNSFIPSLGMCSNQMLPLLWYPGVHSHRFYIVQVEEAAMPGAGQSFGIDKLPMAVLRNGYKVPFHHLPFMSLVPQVLSLHGRVCRQLCSRSWLPLWWWFRLLSRLQFRLS